MSDQTHLQQRAEDASTTQSAPTRSPGQIALQEIIRPVAIAVMLTCLAVALSVLLGRIVPDWPGQLFAILAFFASLESIQAYRILARRDVGSRDRLRFRFVEWVTLLLIIRFGAYFHYGWDRLLEDAATWTVHAIEFFNYGFAMSAVLVFAFWYMALILARAVWELEVTPIEHMPTVTDPGYYLRATMPHHGQTDRRARMFLIISTYLLGGTLLLMFTGMAQLDLRSLEALPNARLGALGANALVYFAVGLLLISQARYTVLRAQWELQGIAIRGRIGQRWMALAIGFLAVTALGAVLLPAGYSVPVFEAVSIAARWLAWIVIQALLLTLFFAAVAVRFVLELLTGQPQPQTPMPTPRPTPVPPTGVQGRGPSLAWQLLRSLLFWWALLGIAAYSVVHFFGDRIHLLRWLKRTKVWAWLRGLWQALQRTMRAAWSGSAQAVRSLAARARAHRAQRTLARSRTLVSLRRLSPRERARFYYLATLRRAERAGLRRLPHLTPNEYQTVLAQSLPDASRDAEGLTGIFDEARYSAHPIGKDVATRARRFRRQLVRSLQRRSDDTATSASPSDVPTSTSER
jgi:hypothetical protein